MATLRGDRTAAFAFVTANGGLTVVKSALAEPDLSQHVRALTAT
jgi:hypothetical protein